MGRAIIWMVMLFVIVGGITALIASVFIVRDRKGARAMEDQREMARLEQERIEFLRREREES